MKENFVNVRPEHLGELEFGSNMEEQWANKLNYLPLGKNILFLSWTV
jgi:hypothetical protein